MRQASMGLIIASNRRISVIPSEVRNNLDIALLWSAEMKRQATTNGDRAEEAPSYLLNLPGEAQCIN